MEIPSINLKIEAQSKIKRLNKVPHSFEQLKEVIAAQLKDPQPGKNYTIKYCDAQSDLINVSDDDDLLTSYEVAKKELNGNLKFQVTVKPEPKPAAVSEIVGETDKKKEKGEKKKKKATKATKEAKDKKKAKATAGAEESEVLETARTMD